MQCSMVHPQAMKTTRVCQCGPPPPWVWINNLCNPHFILYLPTGNENNTCVSMRATTPVGLWINNPCNQTNSFICENMRRGFTTPKPTTTTTAKLLCPTGWSTYSNLCIKVSLTGQGQGSRSLSRSAMGCKIWFKVGQISHKWDNSGTFSDQICPILGQSDHLWTQI